MRFTTVIENHSFKEGLLEQYGLSFFIETKGGNILLDAGSDESAYINFCTLGFSPEAINAIVVSHNHYDHFGGIPYFLDKCDAPLYLSANAEKDYYLKSFLHKRTLVSCTDTIRKYRDRITFVEDKTEILPDVYVCRINKRDPAFFCRDKRLKQMVDGKLTFDDFSHEVYLAVVEDGECIIFSSCSHNGIVNIVEDAQARFEVPVTTFVGGLHMRGQHSNSLNCSRKYVDTVSDTLQTLEVKRVFTCHCTGEKAFRLLKKNDKIDFRYFSTGESFEF